MKLRYLLLLIFTFIWFGPLVGHANSYLELIEQYPWGQINWTQGTVVSKAASVSQVFHGPGPNGRTLNPTFEQAIQNVINTLMQLRMDDQRCASHIIKANENFREKVEAMARSSKVVHAEHLPDDGEKISIQMSLYGGFAQLMLPAEIRQVQPVKPLNNKHDRPNPQSVGKDFSDGFTGLVVDARGTGAKPSMVPKLLDEKGHEVFGPAYVSREYAVQYGICQYVRLINSRWSPMPRVAPNPLLVKGLRAAVPKSCNIVISNADASRLRGKSVHLEFLKKCRVVIVLD